MVRIEFDLDCCIGSGICESLVEDVFSVDNDGVMTVVTDVVSDEREDAVTQAVARCPTGAIRVRSQG
jgi:ferredoxin